MKKVIELLESANKILMGLGRDLYHKMTMEEISRLNQASGKIHDALTELQAPPRWETPEQYRERTGEVWPYDWAVYALYEKDDGKAKVKQWVCEEYKYALRKRLTPIAIVCATEAGKPPENWRPKEP